MQKSKIAIITGGTGALGQVIVNHLASNGIKIYVPVRSLTKFMQIFDNSQNEEDNFKGLNKIYGIPCDASNELEVKEFCENVIKQENQIDYLINTIGGYHPKRLVIDTDTELIEKQLLLNFYSAFYFTKHSLPYFIKSNFGRVISISAKAAAEPAAGKFAYSLSKYAVINLMKTLTEEYKDMNITFNTIIPSIIDTPLNRENMQNQDFTKWINPNEIAEICLLLIRDELKSFKGNLINLY